MAKLKPEQRIKKRIETLFGCANLAEVARRTGYPRSSIQNWKKNPLSIPAVCLETLEDILGTGKEKYKYE